MGNGPSDKDKNPRNVYTFRKLEKFHKIGL